jgi:fumarate reductase subunit C
MMISISNRRKTDMLVFVTWITLSVIVGIAASRHFNRDGFGWAVLSAIVSPLITFLLLLALGPKGAILRQLAEPSPPRVIEYTGEREAMPPFFIVLAVLGVIGLLTLIVYGTI